MKYFFASLLLAVSFVPFFASAAIPPVTGNTQTTVSATGGSGPRAKFAAIVPIPGITDQSADLSFDQYVNRIFLLSVQIGALLAVIMIVYGGFEYMTSAAGITKKDGAEKIQGAVTGLILLLASTLILSIINPCLINLNVFNAADCSGTPVSTGQNQPVTNPNSVTNAASGLTDTPEGAESSPSTFACSDGTQSQPTCYTSTQYRTRQSSQECDTGQHKGYTCISGRTTETISLTPLPSDTTIGACATPSDSNSTVNYCCNTAHTSCTRRTGATCTASSAQSQSVTTCRTLAGNPEDPTLPFETNECSSPSGTADPACTSGQLCYWVTDAETRNVNKACMTTAQYNVYTRP